MVRANGMWTLQRSLKEGETYNSMAKSFVKTAICMKQPSESMW